jgi:hypothetical protein
MLSSWMETTLMLPHVKYLYNLLGPIPGRSGDGHHRRHGAGRYGPIYVTKCFLRKYLKPTHTYRAAETFRRLTSGSLAGSVYVGLGFGTRSVLLHADVALSYTNRNGCLDRSGISSCAETPQKVHSSHVST